MYNGEPPTDNCSSFDYLILLRASVLIQALLELTKYLSRIFAPFFSRITLSICLGCQVASGCRRGRSQGPEKWILSRVPRRSPGRQHNQLQVRARSGQMGCDRHQDRSQGAGRGESRNSGSQGSPGTGTPRAISGCRQTRLRDFPERRPRADQSRLFANQAGSCRRSAH